MRNDEVCGNAIEQLGRELDGNLKSCGIEIKHLCLAVFECRCKVQMALDNPGRVTGCKIQASSNFPVEEMRSTLDNLKSDIEKAIVDYEKNCTRIDCAESDYEKENAEALWNLNESFQKCFRNFSMSLNKFIVCVPKIRKTDIRPAEGWNFLFIIAWLHDDDMSGYREIMEYALDLISDRLERVDAILGFLKSEFFDLNMPNMRVFVGNYVEWFLKRRGFPKAEVLIELSAEKYEGSESEARIYFNKEDVCVIGVLDTLGKDDRVIHPGNRRMIRKMMEISKKGKVYLLAEKNNNKEDNAEKNWIITKLVEKNAEKKTETGSYIKFFGYLCWSIVCEGKEKIIYEKGQYILNDSSEKKEYMAKINNMKSNLSMNPMPGKLKDWFASGRMERLIEILQKQGHGTAVILTDSDAEAKRLCEMNRGTLVGEDKGICKNNEEWNTERLLSVTRIDGALFMNFEGTCIAIGVIVDGVAKIKGDAGKGARYNSIANYVRQQKEGTFLGIIISEDGMVELTCNLE